MTNVTSVNKESLSVWKLYQTGDKVQWRKSHFTANTYATSDPFSLVLVWFRRAESPIDLTIGSGPWSDKGGNPECTKYCACACKTTQKHAKSAYINMEQRWGGLGCGAVGSGGGTICFNLF